MVKLRTWTEKDFTMLCEAYSKDGIGCGIKMNYPEELLSRHSRYAIQMKAHRLGISNPFRESVIKIREWEETEIAYLAGLIDGEGCIDIREIKKKDGKSRYPCRVHITNTHLGLIEWLKAKIGHGCYCRDSRDRENHKVAYTFVISATNDVLDILERCLPYLIVKRDKALKAIQFIKAKAS